MALQDINRNDIFFENVVRAALEDNKADVRNVVLVNESMATVKGQNFFSTMKRLHLKYSHYQKNNDCSNETTEKTITLILKEEPTDILLLEQVRSLNLFGTELPILEDVLPEIEKLICRKIGPKFLYGNAKKSQIIMEDLCALGFKNIDAPLGFSEAHTLMVIEELAKFHAGSVALNEMQSGCLQRFSSSLISDKTHKNFLKMVESFTESLGEIVSNWSDEKCARTAPKFQKLATNIIERLKKVTDYDKDEFCVLNHGDCWMSNIMFRENKLQKPKDIRFVDFQMCIWCSPAIDLIYFLTVCPQLPIKISRHEFFLRKYLATLKKTMQHLHCNKKIPTLNELKQSMEKRGPFAVRTGIIFWSKILASSEGDIETISDILDTGCSDMTIFERPMIIDAMRKIIPWMDQKGYLD